MFYTDYKGVLEDEYCFQVLDRLHVFSLEQDLPGRVPLNSDNLHGVYLMRPEYEKGYDQAIE